MIIVSLLIALLTGSLIYFFNQNTTGIIGGVVGALVAFGAGFAVQQFKDKFDSAALLWGSLGFIAALAAFGLAFPALSQLPSYINYALLGVMASGATAIFYNYNPGRPSASAQVVVAEQNPDEVADIPRIRTPKVLDTSIVIDGRIIDIATTGFVQGPFIVPNFVLRELQLISDSPDGIKRNRGRRGLDMLNSLQKREDLEVEISYKDYTDTREVDAKLIKLSKELGAHLITNDFNLNKVAELQGIQVLNINNLANALKPVVLPGEEMDLQVVKEGKDENQGIGYLDDGTMVVIENGGRLLGKKIKVSVTSIIQTNAGKMIFTKVADGRDSDSDSNERDGGRDNNRDNRGGRSRRGRRSS